MALETGTANATLHFDGGERVYPCRCGKTHRGPYAANDWAHHNCMHDDGLVSLSEMYPDDLGYEPDGSEHVMCCQCGKSFWLERRFGACQYAKEN